MFVFFKVISKVKKLREYFSSINTLTIENKTFQFAVEKELNVDFVSFDDKKITLELKKNIQSINSYLKNNKGSAADFNIIKDITERHIDTIVNGINSTVSAPLFLGLAGTFFGIIYGLSFLRFEEVGTGVSVITPAESGDRNRTLPAVIPPVLTSRTRPYLVTQP